MGSLEVEEESKRSRLRLRCWLQRSALPHWGLCSVGAQPGTPHAAHTEACSKCFSSLGRASPSRMLPLQFATDPCCSRQPPALLCLLAPILRPDAGHSQHAPE